MTTPLPLLSCRLLWVDMAPLSWRRQPDAKTALPLVPPPRQLANLTFRGLLLSRPPLRGLALRSLPRRLGHSMGVRRPTTCVQRRH